MRTTLLILFLLIEMINVSAQTVGLQFGSHLIPEKVLFETQTNLFRPFTFVGISFRTKDISTSITYGFQLKIISISSNVPIWKIKRKK